MEIELSSCRAPARSTRMTHVQEEKEEEEEETLVMVADEEGKGDRRGHGAGDHGL